MSHDALTELWAYVRKHTTRGDCQCGLCAVSNGTDEKPTNHTINLTFFTVGMKDYPDVEEFKRLFKAVRPLPDSLAPLSYIELGAVLEDQGIALQTMALGHLLGVWTCLSPDTEYPDYTIEQKQELAGFGGVIIIKKIDYSSLLEPVT